MGFSWEQGKCAWVQSLTVKKGLVLMCLLCHAILRQPDIIQNYKQTVVKVGICNFKEKTKIRKVHGYLYYLY